jgi:hypothetical protein
VTKLVRSFDSPAAALEHQVPVRPGWVQSSVITRRPRAAVTVMLACYLVGMFAGGVVGYGLEPSNHALGIGVGAIGGWIIAYFIVLAAVGTRVVRSGHGSKG